MTPETQHRPGSRRAIVVGAGIVGMSSALWLQRHGWTVTVVDRQAPGHGTSFGNACTFATYHIEPIATPDILARVPRMLLDPTGPLAIRWGYLPRLLPWLTRFLLASTPGRVAALTRELAGILAQADAGYAPLFEQAGAQDLIRRRGAIELFEAARAHAARRQVELYRSHGVAAEFLDTGDLQEMEPALHAADRVGILYPDASHTLSPLTLTERFVVAFREAGGVVRQAAVRAVEPLEAGARVRLDDGDALTADAVVVAAGAWSRTLAGAIGDAIPLDTERGYHVVFGGAGNLLSRPVCSNELGFYMTPMADGLRVAGTVELGGLEAPPTPVRIEALVRGARRYLPIESGPDSHWMGFRPSLPDSKPVIGRSAASPHVIYAFGHGHLGLTLAGITGRLVADLADGRPPVLDPAPFAATRF